MLTPAQAAAFLEARQSTFTPSFSGERIPDAVLRAILDAARWAPTHKLTEPWRFHVFAEAGVRRFFGTLQAHYEATTPPEARKASKLEKYAANAERVSHVVAVCMARDAKERVPEVEEVIATACAAHNVWLSLAPQGVVGYWSTDQAFTPEVHAFLELGPADRCLGYFYLGLPGTDVPPRPKVRRPLADVSRWYVA